MYYEVVHILKKLLLSSQIIMLNMRTKLVIYSWYCLYCFYLSTACVTAFFIKLLLQFQAKADTLIFLLIFSEIYALIKMSKSICVLHFIRMI